MADEKVYTPTVIEDSPLPGEVSIPMVSSGSTSGDVVKPQKIGENNLPTQRIAVEVIGKSLDTKSRKIIGVFDFTEYGAIHIGKYEYAQSGDIRLSPNGIVARNQNGDTTFALDGDTGDAVFAGQIRSGSLITGQVIVGDNRIIIDGENKQIIINDGITDRVLIGYLPNGF